MKQGSLLSAKSLPCFAVRQNGEGVCEADGRGIRVSTTFVEEPFYLCLDEFCELDKIEDTNMQIQVAELIKQLFFKNSLFSVKIASIWNLSNMYSRGRGKRAEGIELNNDIFPGPDLDMMFVRDGVDAQTYFKDVILNIYLLSSEEADSMSDDAKQRLSNLFEESIFGKEGFRHLIIGSQGVSRAFSILVKRYLEGFTKHRIKYDPLNPHQVYRIIIDQYVTGINSKLPRYTLCNVINEYVRKNQCRYFLIARADYDRCKQLLKWLESRELYRQMPSNLTDSAIREKYKLFVIHYGNYLEALSYNALESGETKPQAGGMRKLSQDAETEELVPKYNSIPYGLAIDMDYRRMQYVRYADDFLIGVIGSKADCEQVKSEIKSL